MNKILVLVAVLVTFSGNIFGQNDNSCILLKQIFSNSEMQKVFLLKNNFNKPIVIIDGMQIFKDCDLINYRGSEIKYIYDSNYIKNTHINFRTETKIDYIVIHKMVRKKIRYILF
jgi:hypothetical protein